MIRKAKLVLLKIYRARGSPHEIALGAAIGAFWGVFPTFGLSTILTLLLYRFLRFNVLVAISAAFISNPLTSPFLLASSYAVGSCFVQPRVEFNLARWREDLPQVGYALFVGAAIVSSLTALLVYVITLYALRRRQKRKAAHPPGT